MNRVARSSGLLLSALGLLATCSVVMAQAQPPASANYPARTIRIIVAQAPGSGTDIVARTIAQKLTESWSQQVIVDNRPGANALIGYEMGAKAKPDGYTLLMAVPSALTINQHVYKKLPYDPERDFSPVTQATSLTFVFVTNPTVPAKTLKEFIALAQAKPSYLHYSSPGIGNLMHLSAVMFAMQTGTKMNHVPNRGEPGALLDVMTGQVDMMIVTMPSATPYLKTGRLRALAVLSPKRSSIMPEIPATPELGYPRMLVTGWVGVLAPAGTSADVVDKLQKEIAKHLLSPSVRDSLVSQGADPVGSTPDEFAKFISQEAAKWGAVARNAALSAQ
jgi:tripartite-type tricarboxylate transporter receptor subunit TctC